MEQMFSLLEEHREVEDRPGAKPLRVEAGIVRFERVSFNYDRRRTVLEDVSFEVPAGRSVAIVGPSGAGKSTISRLLRSEEHTSELQSLMRISYAVFCLKKKKEKTHHTEQ